MNGKFLYIIALLTFLALLQQPAQSKKVIIHVPYRVKNVKHTHTVYKIIPHHSSKGFKSDDSGEDDKYEIYRR